jgi:hypothetical protein
MPLKYLLDTRKQALAVDLEVAVQKPCRVRVMVVNPDKPNTVYFDRFKDVVDRVPFEIKMPLTAQKSRLIVGCIGNSNDDNVRITKLERKKLITHAPCLNGNGGAGSKVREFLKFAEEFSENAAIYQFGTYYSDKRNFRIDYFPVIKDAESGKYMTTPARINNYSGRIEVAKKTFLPCSVPSRIAILMHEFAHFNLNEVQHDEIEADLNALKIYLGAGYPKIEAHKGFLDVFKTHPSNDNRNRYEFIKKFIDDFEIDKVKNCLP